MLLNFPQMHPALLTTDERKALPQDVRFLDPGLGAANSAEHLRPEAAPFDARTAKALLADTLRLGESQAHPGDLLAQSLVEQAGALSPESGRAVQAEVEKSLLGSQAQAQLVAPLLSAQRQGQMLLLLAWNLEERLLELQGVEGRLKTAWDRLDQSVAAGPDAVDDEADLEAISIGRELSGLTRPEASAMNMPWRKLLESYVVLLPGQALCTVDPAIGASLAEAGIPEAPLDEMPGAQRVFRAQAWRLIGHEALPQNRPWLDALLTLGVFGPAGNR